MIFILVSFFVFKSSIVTVLANPINLGQNHDSPISSSHTYDENIQSTRVENGHSGRVAWVFSEKETRVSCEVLLRKSSVAAKGGEAVRAAN